MLYFAQQKQSAHQTGKSNSGRFCTIYCFDTNSLPLLVASVKALHQAGGNEVSEQEYFDWIKKAAKEGIRFYKKLESTLVDAAIEEGTLPDPKQLSALERNILAVEVNKLGSPFSLRDLQHAWERAKSIIEKSKELEHQIFTMTSAEQEAMLQRETEATYEILRTQASHRMAQQNIHHPQQDRWAKPSSEVEPKREESKRGIKLGTSERVTEFHRLVKSGMSHRQAKKQAHCDPSTYYQRCKEVTGEEPIAPYR